MEQQNLPAMKMWPKSTENLLCAENALANAWCSAGMSRCYYAMRQAVLVLAARMVECGRLSATVLEEKEGDHGKAAGFVRSNFDRRFRGTVNELMALRSIADYRPDPVTESELGSSLEKVKALRDEIVRKLSVLNGRDSS